MEIPWIGSIKLMVNGNGSNVPTNSKISLFVSILALIALVVTVSVLTGYISKRMRDKSKLSK